MNDNQFNLPDIKTPICNALDSLLNKTLPNNLGFTQEAKDKKKDIVHQVGQVADIIVAQWVNDRIKQIK